MSDDDAMRAEIRQLRPRAIELLTAALTDRPVETVAAAGFDVEDPAERAMMVMAHTTAAVVRFSGTADQFAAALEGLGLMMAARG